MYEVFDIASRSEIALLAVASLPVAAGFFLRLLVGRAAALLVHPRRG
jgi:hypothetical protein